LKDHSDCLNLLIYMKILTYFEPVTS
jgi:hypothetical protein